MSYQYWFGWQICHSISSEDDCPIGQPRRSGPIGENKGARVDGDSTQPQQFYVRSKLEILALLTVNTTRHNPFPSHSHSAILSSVILWLSAFLSLPRWTLSSKVCTRRLDVLTLVMDAVAFDRFYAYIAPLEIASNASFVPPHIPTFFTTMQPKYLSSIPRDNIYRQFVSLWFITVLFDLSSLD